MPGAVKVGRVEINTRDVVIAYGTVHWCNDKGHFYVWYSPANVPKLSEESLNT